MNVKITMVTLMVAALILLTNVANALVVTGQVSVLAAPGQSAVPLVLSIINNGESALFNITIKPIFTYPFGPYNYFNSSYKVTIPVLPPGSSINITELININPSAGNGVYELKVNATYVELSEVIVNRSMIITPRSASSTFNITIPVLGYVKFNPGLPTWGSINNPIEATPGIGILPLVIPILNTGNVMASNASATIILSNGLVPIINRSYIGYVPPGTPVYAVFLVNITNKAPVGVINGEVILHYFSNATQVITVNIPIIGEPRLVVEGAGWGSPSNPIAVGPGYGIVPLFVTIVNSGTANAVNINATLSLPRGFTTLVNFTTIGGAPVGIPVYAVFIVNVSDVSPGTYYANLTLTYNNGLKSTLRVPIVVSGEPKLISEGTVWGSPSSPITVGPGYGAVPLTFIIVNSGTAPAMNVKANVSLPAGFIALTSNATIGDLPIGVPVYVTFMVNVTNVKAGTYYANLTLTYSGGLLTIRRIPIIVTGVPNVIVESYYTNPPNLFPGYPELLLTVYLGNSGTAVARNVKITLIGDKYISVINPSNGAINIGNLPVGEPIPVNFILSTANNIYGTVQANLTLIINGTGFNKTYTIPLVIKPKANILIINATSDLSVGDSNVPLYITIVNNGNVTAKNVEVILNGQGVIEPHVSSSNPLSALTAGTLFIGDLKPGQEKQVVFMVDVQNGINPGDYKVTLTLLWNQTGSLIPMVQNDEFTVHVNPSLSQQFVSLLIPNKLASILFYVVLILIIILLVLLARSRSVAR
ncbi:COG1361 S-layer family protein [Caldivirga sp. UBA161]|uniref:COG1361 S-layer family protein n=1 Tax=Caldivirga sp. UBA161 TaxID=1915569 RepID=UPI0025C352CA|nr:NEW3 domain-containing protein [Caldivirga sp. UBA161]